jgi:hypothetical protein
VPAKEIVAMGAVGSVPAGLGIVEGGTIPYTPDGLAIRKDNQAHWLERDPEIKCFLPGVPRANYMPYPFQIFQSGWSLPIVRRSRAKTSSSKIPAAARRRGWASPLYWEGNTLVVIRLDRAIRRGSTERATITPPT